MSTRPLATNRSANRRGEGEVARVEEAAVTARQVPGRERLDQGQLDRSPEVADGYVDGQPGIVRVDIRVCTYLLRGDRARMVVREVPALPTDAPYAEVAALAADLLAPFHDELEQLGTEDRLIISPDLTLLGLPFAAVQEHGIISHVYGAGMLEALGDRARRAYEKALLIGAPARARLA